MPRRLVVVLAAVFACALLAAQTPSPASPIVLLSRDGRRPLTTTVLNGQELVGLDDLATLFQLAVREDTAAGGIIISYKGKNVVLSTDRAMASVAGRVVTLPAPPARSGRRWLVPLEFLNRALAPIYDARIDVRRASRLVVVGDIRVPRVTARVDQAGAATRVVLDVAPPHTVTVTGDAGRIVFRVDADVLDVALPVPGTGLIEQVRAGDQPFTVVAVLRPGAGAPQTSTTTNDTGTHVVVDIPPITSASTPGAAAPEKPLGPVAPGGAPVAPVGPVAPVAPETLQAMVIDPGHGGDDDGVNAGGVTEKQITLEVARRIKALIEARLGIRVILTREDDRAVSADERAATANNGKADLFLSLHVNAALSPDVSGAEIFYLSLGREGRQALEEAQADSVALPALGGTTRTLDLIRWDMAQARHIQKSLVLASTLEELLRARVPMGPRPLQHTPLRTLVGVDMPAVLIEMAYLTNPTQAKQVASGEFQSSIAEAVYDGVLRFRGFLEGAQ